MRYIFTEAKKTQAVYDIEIAVLYRIYILDDSLTVNVEGACGASYLGFVQKQAVSFWQQLARQVDQRCAIKDVRERMEVFAEEERNG